MSLYREFALKSPSVWPLFLAFVKSNAAALAGRGECLRLIVTNDEKKRNAEQNKYYWAAVMKPMSEQAWVDGRQYSTDVWHEFMARKHGVCEDMTLPDGEIVVRRKSTSEMTVGEFSAYTTKVMVDATTEYGVEFTI